MKNIPYFFALLFVLISACDQDQKKDDGGGFLAPARGENGEIILIVDNQLWKSELGDELKETFSSPTPGLPRLQPLFNIHAVQPAKLNNLLKAAKNMIFITTLDGRSTTQKFYSSESLQSIKNNPNIFMEPSKDRYAKGQHVLYLFNPTVEGLIKKIKENRTLLQEHFIAVEKQRFLADMGKSSIHEGLKDLLNKKFNIDMSIPKSFEIAIEEENFIWLRQMDPEIDKNIFISSRPYTSEDLFETDSILKWRNDIAGKHIFADPDDPETYITTEIKHAPVDTKKITFNGDYAVETRALWRTNKINMGGPFVSYTFYNETSKKMFYIEGFLYSPGKPQRENLRELEAILSTFKANDI